jgi:ribosome-associated translation inhibitor RaiA
MQILVHTHNAAERSENLNRWVISEMENSLGQFSSRLTRLEVFLSDMNSDKKGIDKRCTIEAKFEGLPSLAASSDGPSVAQALNGAADKMQKVLDRKLKKLNHHKGRNPMGGQPFADMGGSSQEMEDGGADLQ